MRFDDDPLQDFYKRLERLRSRLNVARAGIHELTFETYDKVILEFGRACLVTAQHLAPVRVAGPTGPAAYVAAQDCPPIGVVAGALGGPAATILTRKIAEHVGLFTDTLALLLHAWMTEHGEADPLKPWRLFAAATGRRVPELEHARWVLKIDGKRWADQPWAHAQQQALAWGSQASCELDFPATCRAAGVTL